MHILDKFHNQDMFWKYISLCISEFFFGETTSDEALSKAFQYYCQYPVLHIMANEILLRGLV